MPTCCAVTCLLRFMKLWKHKQRSNSGIVSFKVTLQFALTQ